MNLRSAKVSDMLDIRDCNQQCLPENYSKGSYLYYLTSYPNIQFVAEDQGKIVGYILCAIESKTSSGHIVSLAVKREYRKLGIARKLMELSHKAMTTNYKTIKLVTLHVRPSNIVAFNLYKSFGYTLHRTEKRYYSDGEDGLELVKQMH